jgi:hypothetical protein
LPLQIPVVLVPDHLEPGLIVKPSAIIDVVSDPRVQNRTSCSEWIAFADVNDSRARRFI